MESRHLTILESVEAPKLGPWRWPPPRVARKLVLGSPLWHLVLAGLASGLSPEQVGGTLARMPEPVHISHETIYNAIYTTEVFSAER